MTAITSLVDQYVKERLTKGEISRLTASNLRYRLSSFACTINVDPRTLTRRHVDKWLMTPGLSPSYRRLRLSSLRTFCEWMVLHGHITKDPTLGVRPPRQPKLLPRALSAEQSEAVARTAATWPDRRAPLMVSLMLNEALRRAEVAHLQLGDIDRRDGTLTIRGKGGHGHVTARLPMTEETRRLLTRYLPYVPYSSGPLFRSHLNPDVGISPQRVGIIVLNVMKAAGVKEYAFDGRSAHALRHTAAQDLIDRGADMRVVQRVLRHESIKTTEGYVRGEVRGLREVMEGRHYFSPVLGEPA